MPYPKRQPKELFILFFTEMWERFGYYVLRSALVLYMTQKLLFSEELSFAVFGGFSSFLYLSPLAGGLLADRLLGRKCSVIFGGLFLCLGYLSLTLPWKYGLHAGLSVIIVGNGLFKPNMSSLIGSLYAPDDPRREGGFSLFYSGTNLGAMLAALVAGTIVTTLGWNALFLTSSLGCLFAVALFALFRPWKLSSIHDPTVKKPGPRDFCLSMAGIVGLVCVFGLLLFCPKLAGILILVIGAVFVGYALRMSAACSTGERNQVVGCLIVILYVSLLWAIGQQAGMSLTMFTNINVDRNLFGHTLSVELFQVVDPLCIIILGPVLLRFWPALERRGRNPGLVSKCALGTILGVLSCFSIPLGIMLAGDNGLSSPLWLTLCLALQGLTEIIVAPAGLNMIAEHVPKRMSGIMYGIWLYSISLGNLMATGLSQLVTTTTGNENAISTNPLFSRLFTELGLGLLAACLLLLLAKQQLRRLLGGKASAPGKSAT